MTKRTLKLLLIGKARDVFAEIARLAKEEKDALSC